MREELEQELLETYPSLFELLEFDNEERKGPAPPMAIYGITCGDGWFNIIDTLCSQIVSYEVDTTVVQVKEKFGGLRFYHDGLECDNPSDAWKVAGAIRFAEELSFCICEECGSPANVSMDGWYKTICEDCDDSPWPKLLLRLLTK